MGVDVERFLSFVVVWELDVIEVDVSVIGFVVEEVFDREEVVVIVM